MGVNIPDTDSSLLQSFSSNKEHSIESKYIENSTTPSITTSNDKNLADKNETRSGIELLDDDAS